MRLTVKGARTPSSLRPYLYNNSKGRSATLLLLVGFLIPLIEKGKPGAILAPNTSPDTRHKKTGLAMTVVKVKKGFFKLLRIPGQPKNQGNRTPSKSRENCQRAKLWKIRIGAKQKSENTTPGPKSLTSHVKTSYTAQEEKEKEHGFGVGAPKS